MGFEVGINEKLDFTLRCSASLGILMFACYMIVSFMRSRSNLRRRLPSFLMNWDFVPIWMRSLAPYDKYFFLTNFFKHFY